MAQYSDPKSIEDLISSSTRGLSPLPVSDLLINKGLKPLACS
jgi:hypothetical protein